MAVDDAYTKILLHGNGADGGKVFTDEGGNTWEIYDENTATIETDTDVKKFGTASLHRTYSASLTTTQLRMTSGFNAGLNPGSGDFSVDFQHRMGALPEWNAGSDTILAFYANSSNKFTLDMGICDENSPYFYFCLSGKAGGASIGYNYFGYNTPSFQPVTGQMYHIELVRSGNDYLLFIDGNLLETISKSAHTYTMTSGGTIDILSGMHEAWIDEFRYSVGIARHTTNFTPPTGEYVASMPIDSDIPALQGTLSLSATLRFSHTIITAPKLISAAALNAAIQLDLAPPTARGTGALSAASIVRIGNIPFRIYYTCVLSGDGESPALADVILPISSLQGRFNSGAPSYLSVVIPNADYAEQITERSNGDLTVYIKKVFDDGNVIAERLMTVDLESIRLDQGGNSESITLSGHRTVTNTPKAVALIGAQYMALSDGKYRYRCNPDLYLRAGDTVTIDGVTFTADAISLAVNVGRELMEVAEA